MRLDQAEVLYCFFFNIYLTDLTTDEKVSPQSLNFSSIRVRAKITPLFLYNTPLLVLGIISNLDRTGIPGSSMEPKSRFQLSGTNRDHSHYIYCAEFKKKITFCLHINMQGVHPHKKIFFIYLSHILHARGFAEFKIIQQFSKWNVEQGRCAVPILHACPYGLQVGLAFGDFGICNVMAKQWVAFLIFLLVSPTHATIFSGFDWNRDFPVPTTSGFEFPGSRFNRIFVIPIFY